MGSIFPEISENDKRFILAQKIFFVGTSAPEGRINVSPKGMDSLRILGPNKVIWLNLTGSGNETAAHLKKDNRMTILFCSFDRRPLILRLYGNAKTYHPRDKYYQDVIGNFPDFLGARQIIEMQVESVGNSCGFAVPHMEFKKERKGLRAWSEDKGKEEIENYWKQRNSKSIDGFETGIL